MELGKYEKEFEKLKKDWDTFSKSYDKKHWEQFSQELVKFQDNLRNLKL